MAFRYSVFPDCKRFGAVAASSHNVAVVKLRNGVEYRTARGDGATRRYDFTYGLASQFDELSEAHAFYLVMGGGEDSFLARDYLDHNSSPSGHGPTGFEDQVLGTGDGTNTTFQLRKTYVARDPDGAVEGTKIRLIEHPVVGSVSVGVDGSLVASGWTVNKYTGLLTFDTAPPNGEIVSAGFEFYVPVRFSDATSESFEVALTAQDAGEVVVSLIEVPHEGAYSTDQAFGGHYDGSGFNSDIRLSLGDGGFIELNPQVAGLRVFLPNVKNIGEGIGHMWIANYSATHTVDLLPFEGGSALTTIPVASGGVPGFRLIGLKDSGANKVWVAIG